jgi:hypothetical protein
MATPATIIVLQLSGYLTANCLTHSIAMSLNRQCSVLPAELFDSIIDYLHNNPGTLRRCSRVCKSWLPASRFHIFGFVRVEEKNAQRFVEIVLASVVREYIREIRISWLPPLDGAGIFSKNYTSQLIGIIPRLTELPALKSIEHSGIVWPCFNHLDSLRFNAVISDCKVLPIIHLRIENSTFSRAECVMEMISACYRLRSISIDSVSWGKRKTGIIRELPVSPSLEELDLQSLDPKPLLDWLVVRKGFTNIRRLYLPELAEADIPAVAACLRVFGKSLDYLDLQLPSQDRATHGELHSLYHCFIAINVMHWVARLLSA